MTKFLFIPTANGPGYYNVHVASCRDCQREWSTNNSQGREKPDSGDYFSADTAEKAIEACIADLIAGGHEASSWHASDFHMHPCCRAASRSLKAVSKPAPVGKNAFGRPVSKKLVRALDRAVELAKPAKKPVKHGRKAKQLDIEAGFIYKARNASLYDAAKQGIDVGGAKYAIVCRHNSIGQSNDKVDGMLVARHPENFCEKCAKEA